MPFRFQVARNINQLINYLLELLPDIHSCAQIFSASVHLLYYRLVFVKQYIWTTRYVGVDISNNTQLPKLEKLSSVCDDKLTAPFFTQLKQAFRVDVCLFGNQGP